MEEKNKQNKQINHNIMQNEIRYFLNTQKKIPT